MKSTLTLYPKNEEPIELTIKYISQLNGQKQEGFWNIDSNTVILSRRLYDEYSKLEKQSEKKSFFDNLHKVSYKNIQ